MVKIMVVGLGYVGLPISISFAKKFETYGFDINKEKINKYKNGIDITKTVVKRELEETKLNFTTNEKDINKADYIIVTVPTPINENNEPDLKYIVNASEMIARNIKKGATVVYESTVYPGTTEEICVPIIEKIAKMKLNIDFFVGYSPERINPGDSFYKFENIAKIVSGSTESVTENIANLYAKCIKSQIVKVSSIKVAEASKIIENTQRDINIAFINEISKILHCMNIDAQEVLNAASTKWNFLNFKPGLVGGHCISVDPYYLASKAKEMNFNAKVILTARSVNDSMAEYIADLNMSLFFMDFDHNSPSAEHLKAHHENFFLTVREKNPDLPIIMATKTDIPRTPADVEHNRAHRAVVYETYENALKRGDRNVMFIGGETVFTKALDLSAAADCCTVDGCHPNDLGFACMAKVFGDAIEKMLNL